MRTSPFYGNLCGSVSIANLRCITEQYLRIDHVGTNTKICGCTLKTLYWLPYACELGKYRLSGDSIPINVGCDMTLCSLTNNKKIMWLLHKSMFQLLSRNHFLVFWNTPCHTLPRRIILLSHCRLPTTSKNNSRQI